MICDAKVPAGKVEEPLPVAGSVCAVALPVMTWTQRLAKRCFSSNPGFSLKIVGQFSG